MYYVLHLQFIKLAQYFFLNNQQDGLQKSTENKMAEV